MKRIVEPELLDHLSPTDPAARQTRRHLRRINWLMQNSRILARVLQASRGSRRPREILDLGAGDGWVLLQVARQLAPQSNDVRVRMLDRVSVVEPAVVDEFKKLGWSTVAVSGDVFEWFQQRPPPADLVVANLFMHHFVESDLRALLAEIAGLTDCFVAVEPRRARLPLLASSLLWAVGCNAITRHDAVKSVQAGFAGQELSQLWPAAAEWELQEKPVGLFSHLFVARRRT